MLEAIRWLQTKLPPVTLEINLTIEKCDEAKFDCEITRLKHWTLWFSFNYHLNHARLQDVAEEEDEEEEEEEEEDKNWYTYQTMNLNKNVISFVAKQWPLLLKEGTTSNHLKSPKTTSKNSTTIYNHLKDICNHTQTSKYHFKLTSDRCLKEARSQYVTQMKFEKWTKPQPPPRSLLSTVPLYNQPRA